MTKKRKKHTFFQNKKLFLLFLFIKKVRKEKNFLAFFLGKKSKKGLPNKEPTVGVKAIYKRDEEALTATRETRVYTLSL